MPYCSIQEAWGNNFGKPQKKVKKFKIEQNELANCQQSNKYAEYPKVVEKNDVTQLKESPGKVALNDYMKTKKTDTNKVPLYAAQSNLVSDMHMQNQYKKYIEYISKLEKRIKVLEKQLENERKNNNKYCIYNVVLYILGGIFVIFLLDCFVRLGGCLVSQGGLGGSLNINKIQPPRIPRIQMPNIPRGLFNPNFDNYFRF